MIALFRRRARGDRFVWATLDELLGGPRAPTGPDVDALEGLRVAIQEVDVALGGGIARMREIDDQLRGSWLASPLVIEEDLARSVSPVPLGRANG